MQSSLENSTTTRQPGPQSPEGFAPRLPHLPALDGLRALAVISVLLYHADLNWIPGGFLGVEMFFVISGYLITSLLLAEWCQHGQVDLKGFWLRRARRLFPALFLLLLIVVGFTAVFLPTEVSSLRGDALSTAGYFNNWYQIFSHKSYFETVGRPPLLRHMWSLAVEEQFYLFWPLWFGLLMRRLRPGQVLGIALAGAFASMLLMAVLYQPHTDPSRVYYGTDTRAGGLLLGVALAFWWRPGQVISQANGRMLDAVGLAALGLLITFFLVINEYQTFLYRGGLGLTALVTAELVAVAAHPSARLVPRMLSWPALRWIGVRSYGLYLWHFPVFMVTRPQLDVPWNGVLLLAARMGLTVGIAALSYRLVETPIRTGCLGRAWTRWRQAQGVERRRLGWNWAAAWASLLAAGAAVVVVLLTARPPAPPEYLSHKVARKSAPIPASLARTNPAVPTARVASPATQVLAQVHSQVAASAQPPPTPARVAGEGVTAIGDSVMEGVAEELKQIFGANTSVDASQGRLPWNTPAIVHNLHLQGRIQSLVILHIGNNGFFSAEAFEQIMAELKGARRVVVVNLKVPRRWETLNNQMLATSVRAYPNAVLVDWHGLSGDHPQWFWKDGIHLRQEGARVYANLIAQAAGTM